MVCSVASAISTGQVRSPGSGNVMNEDADPLPLPPVWSLGPATLEWGDHELLSARPFTSPKRSRCNVGSSNAIG